MFRCYEGVKPLGSWEEGKILRESLNREEETRHTVQ